MAKSKKAPARKRANLAGAPTLLIEKKLTKKQSAMIGDYNRQTFRRANKPHTRR